MAYSFWVLVNRAALPAPAELQKAIKAARFPLVIDENWSWKKHSGWLPMRWQDVEAGCEVMLDRLPKKVARSAEAAGYPGMDGLVDITIRGWDSMKCSGAFAAVLTKLTGGCITEEEDEYIGPDKAIAWARRGISAAKKGAAAEQAAEVAKADALAAGKPEDQLATILDQCADQELIRTMMVMDSLQLKLANAVAVSSSAWALKTAKGETFDVGRYSAIRAQQMALLRKTKVGKAERKLMDALEAKLDDAGELDASDLKSAQAVLKKWPKKMKIVRVMWTRPDTVMMELNNGDSVTFSSGFSVISVNAGALSFNVYCDEVRIV